MRAVPHVVAGPRSDASCEAPPVGALEPARPAWCYASLEPSRASVSSGPNSWLDGFASATEHAALPSAYRVFEADPSSPYRSVHFVHNGHWMVDIRSAGVAADQYVGGRPKVGEPSDFGGALMRPDRTFRAERGRLVVEADTAASMEAYFDAWPEIVITTAPGPTSTIDPRFTYGIFGGHPVVGCRLMSDRIPVCAAFGPTAAMFDLAHDRSPGGAVFGGLPTGPATSAWRVCDRATPDAQCRDRFRLELEPGRLALAVNGVPYMEHRLSAAQLPAELFDREVYVYFASWLYQPTPAVVRFHWGRLAINP